MTIKELIQIKLLLIQEIFGKSTTFNLTQILGPTIVNCVLMPMYWLSKSDLLDLDTGLFISNIEYVLRNLVDI